MLTMAPCRLERFQNSASNTTGPNTAPKPAHAKETIAKTELSGSSAISTPMTAIKSTVTLSIIRDVFSLTSFFNIPFNKSSDTLDDAKKIT